ATLAHSEALRRRSAPLERGSEPSRSGRAGSKQRFHPLQRSSSCNSGTFPAPNLILELRSRRGRRVFDGGRAGAETLPVAPRRDPSWHRKGRQVAERERIIRASRALVLPRETR